MLFSASARLAERTSDLGDLAERFDAFLEDANSSWVIQAAAVASALGDRRDKVEYLLEQAALTDVGLLVGEVHLRCRNCGNLISLDEIQEADAAEDETCCTQCGDPIEGNEEQITAYRLSPACAEEASQRRERPIRRAVILTALELELDAVLGHLTGVRRETHPRGTVYQVGGFESDAAVWEIAAVSIGAGNPGAASEAERALNHFDPEVAFFVGIAGGIKDVNLGDVVAADEIYLYHAGKALEEFKPKPEVYRPTAPLLSQARAAVVERKWPQRVVGGASGDPRALVAPIAAGEQVLGSASSATYELIREHYRRAVAVEMEGAGFLRGAYGSQNVGALVIRGISDQLANKEQTDEEGWQAKAAAHAAAFAFELMTNLT